MNVFDRVDGLNARIRDLEMQVRILELEKVLRELIEQIDPDAEDGERTQHFIDALNAARYLLKETTGREI
jgi:hypothetical protein